MTQANRPLSFRLEREHSSRVTEKPQAIGSLNPKFSSVC